jgi:hypothetical protein
MKELNPLEKMQRVQAPLGFERRVLAELAVRKEKNVRRRRTWRFSLAGATAIVLVGFITLNVFVLKKQTPAVISGLDKRVSLPQARESMPSKMFQRQAPADTIPIIEPVDYSGEVRSTSQEPRTIYILEQVTEAANTKIIY